MAESKALALINDLMKIHPRGYDLSLGRITGLLERLGNPQDRLPPVIHVAGTNGKGSTIAICRAILEADGKIVHVHTSPHLVHYHERIRIGAKGGGKFVADTVFADALARVADINAGTPITVFEILTAVTFLLFSEHPADVALIEVGLGGRFDCTNVIAKPRISVITPVSLDHESFLGNDIKAIAAEKAGIIKKDVPVVIAEQGDEARSVLENVAVKCSAAAVVGGQDFSFHEEHGRFVYQDENGLLDLPVPNLTGQHQLVNAATAIAALRYGGFEVSTAAIENGLQNIYWPGRLQRLKQGALLDHLVKGSELWIDGGHNPDAGLAISSLFAKLQQKVKRPLYLVFAMLTTKQPEGYFNEFSGLAEHIYTVPITSSEAGFDPQELAILANAQGINASPAASVKEALDQITNNWSQKERTDMSIEPAAPRVLICGSLYLAGDALAQNGMPPE